MNKQIFLRELKGLKEKSCLYQITRPSHDTSTVKWSTLSTCSSRHFVTEINVLCQVATPALWKRTGWDFLKFSADLEHAETVKV